MTKQHLPAPSSHHQLPSFRPHSLSSSAKAEDDSEEEDDVGELAENSPGALAENDVDEDGGQ